MEKIKFGGMVKELSKIHKDHAYSFVYNYGLLLLEKDFYNIVTQGFEVDFFTYFIKEDVLLWPTE